MFFSIYHRSINNFLHSNYFIGNSKHLQLKKLGRTHQKDQECQGRRKFRICFILPIKSPVTYSLTGAKSTFKKIESMQSVFALPIVGEKCRFLVVKIPGKPEMSEKKKCSRITLSRSSFLLIRIFQ